MYLLIIQEEIDIYLKYESSGLEAVEDEERVEFVLEKLQKWHLK